MTLARRWPLVVLFFMLAGADPAPQWLALDRAANEAIRAQDFAALRKTLVALAPLEPGNARNTYNLAASAARLGDRAAALAGVTKLAAMGLAYDVAADDDFASLRDDPAFIAARKRLDDNRRPTTHARLVATLAPDLLPEDLAYDAATKRWFVSSVRFAKIVTLDGKTFAKADWPVLALRIDPTRRFLWAATGWVPHCEHCDAADRDKSALVAFDLDSGALRKRVDSPVKGLLADMTIGKNGDLFVSEGIHGAVLRLPAGGDSFTRLDTPGDFPSPQTPALSPDESLLYVADYHRGIATIDLRTRVTSFVQPAAALALDGIDGFYAAGDDFIAVQNGTHPPRIVRFARTLDRAPETLEANWPALGEPTHGAIVGGEFYFLANSGWNAYDEKGKKKPGSAPIISTVRALRL
jgi:hypothetical protein